LDEAASGISVHETIRAIAVLYYLHNPRWHPGDGGETGIYSYHRQPVLGPTKAVPPINNSLLLFECRSNSFISRAVSQEEIPFLQFTTCHSAGSHLFKPIGESSKIVPVFSEKVGQTSFTTQRLMVY
jgi:hypothetical protein